MKKVLFVLIVNTFLFGNAYAQTAKLPQKKKASSSVETKTTNSLPSKTAETPSQPEYQFSVGNGPKDIDSRPPLQFKVDSGAETTPVAGTMPPDAEGFKTYIGYPKHQVKINLMPMNLSSKWKYNGNEISYSSSGVLGLDLSYKVLLTPQMDMEVAVSSYKAGVAANTIGALTVHESNETITTYFLRYNYYWISDSNFFRRWGPGIEVGYSSFPLMDFSNNGANNTDLEMSHITDFTLGAYFNYDFPILPTILFVGKVGADLGTGIGNTGRMSTKSNLSYYIDVGTRWTLSEVSAINVSLNSTQQNTEVSGVVNGAKDSWKSDTVITSFKIGYTHTF